MAVYTDLSAHTLEALIATYDVGALRSAKGIAEGVSNSNWLIETTQARFILTMYERRIEIADLPYFLGLLDHLSAHNCPVPRTMHDRDGKAFSLIDGKAVALIEFLPGISIDVPTPAQAHSVGAALAKLHKAAATYPHRRTNGLRPRDWADIFDACKPEDIAKIDPQLSNIIAEHLADSIANWPEHLPHATIHADLFPDNVLMIDDQVSALIDFYFACTDITAYDIAVTHAAWCFSSDGRQFRPDISAALLQGYFEINPLSADEIAALPILAKGACLRFIATRCYDWIETPADALVKKKNPMDFARRLEHYQHHAVDIFAL